MPRYLVLKGIGGHFENFSWSEGVFWNSYILYVSNFYDLLDYPGLAAVQEFFKTFQIFKKFQKPRACSAGTALLGALGSGPRGKKSGDVKQKYPRTDLELWRIRSIT